MRCLSASQLGQIRTQKSQIAFLTEQYKSYCFGCGYPYKPLSKKGNTVEDRFIGSLQDLKSRLCKIFEDIDQGKFVVPNEPASAAVSADEAIEAEQIEGFGTLSHIREIAADQFMGPMPAEVERLKTLNSCLPDQVSMERCRDRRLERGASRRNYSV